MTFSLYLRLSASREFELARLSLLALAIRFAQLCTAPDPPPACVPSFFRTCMSDSSSLIAVHLRSCIGGCDDVHVSSASASTVTAAKPVHMHSQQEHERTLASMMLVRALAERGYQPYTPALNEDSSADAGAASESSPAAADASAPDSASSGGGSAAPTPPVLMLQLSCDVGPRVVASLRAYGREWAPVDVARLQRQLTDAEQQLHITRDPSPASRSASSRASASDAMSDEEAKTPTSDASFQLVATEAAPATTAPAGAASSSASSSVALLPRVLSVSDDEVLLFSLNSALLSTSSSTSASSAPVVATSRVRELSAALASAERGLAEAEAAMSDERIGSLYLRVSQLRRELAAAKKSQPDVLEVRDCIVLPLGFVMLDGEAYYITRCQATVSSRALPSRVIAQMHPQARIQPMPFFNAQLAVASARSGSALSDSIILRATHLTDLNKLFSGKLQKLTLLYSGKRDGYTGRDFHRLCDGKGATLTVARAITKGQTYVFGGYNSQSWSSRGGWVPSSCWVYSLESPTGLLTKYVWNPGDCGGALHAETYGPTFAGELYNGIWTLHISNSMKTTLNYSLPLL